MTIRLQRRFRALILLVVFAANISHAVQAFDENQNDKPITELHVRGDSTYPPFEYNNERGEPEGFNVDMMIAVARAMGRKAKIDLGPWDEVVSQLERGKIDVLIGMFNTEERHKKFDFSEPFYVGSYTIFVRDDSKIQSIAEVKDKTIIVELADLGQEWVKESGLFQRVITKGDWRAVLKALSSGEGDCAIVSELQGSYLIREMSLTNLKAVGPPIIQREYGFAVAEGNTALLSELNEGLSIIKSNGQYDAIFKKWFGVYEEQAFADVLKERLVLLLPLLGVTAAAFAWAWTLRKRTQSRTPSVK